MSKNNIPPSQISQLNLAKAYLIAVVPIFILLFAVLFLGKKILPTLLLTHNENNQLIPVITDSFESNFSIIKQNLNHAIALLLAQIFLILVASRLVGNVFKKWKQPVVMGEIVAGILLGPSALGWIFPEYLKYLFPSSALASLQALSQMGLVLFMFVIGLEMDLNALKNRVKSALFISHVSIVLPYFLGVILAFFIFKNYAPNNTSFISFALFMGIAMSITAFPVLARILQERKLIHTELGSMTITCAAIDDISAWSILAFVVAIVKSVTLNSAIVTLVLVFFHLIIMIGVIKPWLASRANDKTLTNASVIICVLIASSWFTETIGIHALFGAFLTGAIVPRTYGINDLMRSRVEDVSVLLFLPIFFTITGLRTQLNLLSHLDAWLLLGLVIFLAVLGKLGGAYWASKKMGIPTLPALKIGVLMNTRGLMEIIVLNIGFELGILTPLLFTVMILMAIVTTMMTGPLLNYLDR